MKTKLFTFILILSISIMAIAQQKKTVAVLNPVCRDNSVSNIYYSIVRGSFESVASETEGYEAFDRSALDQIMHEHGFQRSGVVDEAQIRQLGKFAGVDYVLVTDIAAEDGYLMVIAKILNVETAKYDRSVDELMEMTPPRVKAGCAELAQRLFKKNINTGNQTGEIIWNGLRYVGEYKDGKPNGKGKLYGKEDSDLDYYDGNFSDGAANGLGTTVFKNGKRIEGTMVNNRMHGYGKVILPNGVWYDGTFSNGNLYEGTMYLPTGERYVGRINNDKPDGAGKFFEKDGNTWVGVWKDGKMTGIFSVYMSDGSKHTVEFKYGVMSIID